MTYWPLIKSPFKQQPNDFQNRKSAVAAGSQFPQAIQEE
jgi:hypothetical protein